MDRLQATIEAVLFAAGDAIPIERLAAACDVPRDQLEIALAALSDYYDFERRGIRLIRMEDKIQLCTRAEFAEEIRRAIESRKPPQLSAAALEVLTIVAYRQPVTRAYIDQLRGVDSGGTVAGLVDKGMIEEAGRLDVPGRPILYQTTEQFLRTFAISNLNQLPPLPELIEGEQLQLEMKDGVQAETETE